MPNHRIPLEAGKYYHIYNRGINRCPIFFEPDNYEHFLRLYDIYISPVANTFAWVLMGNHFHLLVQILPSNPEGFKDLRGLCLKKKTDFVTHQFSNLFNAYAKAINKRYERTGSLFEHSFRRKHIDEESYLKNVVMYIHQNPVHHGFCSHPFEYPWSSYLTCISVKPTRLQRDAVVGWFGDNTGFAAMHNTNVDMAYFEQWFEL